MHNILGIRAGGKTLEKGTIILEDKNGNIVNVIGLINIKSNKNHELIKEMSFKITNFYTV